MCGVHWMCLHIQRMAHVALKIVEVIVVIAVLERSVHTRPPSCCLGSLHWSFCCVVSNGPYCFAKWVWNAKRFWTIWGVNPEDVLDKLDNQGLVFIHVSGYWSQTLENRWVTTKKSPQRSLRNRWKTNQPSDLFKRPQQSNIKVSDKCLLTFSIW